MAARNIYHFNTTRRMRGRASHDRGRCSVGVIHEIGVIGFDASAVAPQGHRDPATASPASFHQQSRHTKQALRVENAFHVFILRALNRTVETRRPFGQNRPANVTFVSQWTLRRFSINITDRTFKRPFPDSQSSPPMTKVVDYYYSLTSPWTYLGHARFLRIAAAAGATVNCKPCDFGVIFPKTGGVKLNQRAPQRQVYRMMELKRWRAFNDVELNLEPKYFPAASETARLMTIACGEAGLDIGLLSGAILRGVWVEERNIADEPTLTAIANEQGMDGAALLEATRDETIATIAEANIAEALARNVFGAPTYIYQNENFWGQDRLDFVERALAA